MHQLFSEHLQDACNILLESEPQLNLSIGMVLLHVQADVSWKNNLIEYAIAPKKVQVFYSVCFANIL